MNEETEVRTEKRKRGTGRIWKMGFTREPDADSPEHAVWKRQVWWIQFYDAAHRCRRESSGSTTRKVAEKLLARRLAEREAGSLPTERARGVTYESLRDAYYAEYVEKERRSLRFDKAGRPRISAVVRLDGFFSGYSALEITPDSLHEFIRKAKDGGSANQTIQHSLNALKHMFRIATREKKLPVDAAPHFPKLQGGTRTGFLTRDVFLRLRGELPERLRCPLTLAYDTGMRRGEVFGLRWTDVDIKAREIRLEVTKNGEKRTVPIGRELLAMLEIEREKYPAAEFVFMRTDREGRPVRVLSFRKAWASAAKRAGVSGTLFHDLRRTAVRNMVRSGIPERVAMAISGHKTRAIFDRYNIVDGDDLSVAAKLLEAYQKREDAARKRETARLPRTSGQTAPEPKPKNALIN
jgi:integrase